jgi:hypothetical protein
VQHTHQSYFSNLTGPIDVDALMAFHRRNPGVVMEEGAGDGGGETATSEDQASEQTTDETKPEDKPEEGETKEAETDEGKSEDEGNTLSHEDAIAALKKTRKSEAGYRTRLRELEKVLENAKTPEEFEAAITELKTTNATEARSLMVENVVLHAKLPAELATTLTATLTKLAEAGSTREELEAHAKALAKFAPTEESDPENLEGGLIPRGSDGSFDPKAIALANRKRRY